MELLVLILLPWNLITFLMMGLDKRKAKRGAWRISERVLLLCALVFGSLGATAGMYCFRHKTRHKRFSVGLPVMLILHAVIAVYLTNQGLFGKI